MAHLVSCYARSMGVKVGKPILQPHFFPFLYKDYITIHTSDKCPSKNYSYWPEVVKILKLELVERGIKIVQLGTEVDPKIEGVDIFLNNLSFKQSSYILSNSKVHVGIDSSPVHISSALNRNTVSIYAHCYKEIAEPVWNKDKAVIIESDRGGKKPSFSNHEDPKEIDRIKPEQIAESVFKILNIRNPRSQKTIFIGKNYLDKLVDIIPTLNPSDVNIVDSRVRVRMDLVHNEDILRNILHHCNGKIEILTRNPISRDILLGYRKNIDKVTYESDLFDSNFLNLLHTSGLNFEIICLSEENLSSERLKYFNYEINFSNRVKEAQSLMKEYGGLKGKMKFDSSRIYIEGENKIPALSQNQNEIQFWIDARYFRIYEDQIL